MKKQLEKNLVDKAIKTAKARAKRTNKTQHIYIKGQQIEILASDAMYVNVDGKEGEIPQGFIYHGLVHPDGRMFVFTK